MFSSILSRSNTRLILFYSTKNSFRVNSNYIHQNRSKNYRNLFFDVQKRPFLIRSSLLQQQQKPQLRKPPQLTDEQLEQQEILLKAARGSRRPKLSQKFDRHEGDGLKANEWTLIYENSQTWWLFTMMFVYSVVTMVFLLTGVQELADRRKKLLESKEELSIRKVTNRTAILNLSFGLGVFATLIAFRRRWIVRIYEKNLPKQKKPPRSIALPSAGTAPSGAQQEKIDAPVRRYCIVWVNTLFRRRQFFYNNDEASRVREYTPMVANILGNYVAKNRPWAVFHQYFEDALDYYRVRGKRVAGGTFIG